MKDWKLALVVGGVALGGVVVGAQCFGARPPAAQTAGVQYRRCIIARQESIDTGGDGSFESIDLAHSIRIPDGWEVLGGGGPGNNWLGTVVLCER